MKKLILLLTVAVAGVAGLSSCEKEPQEESQKEPQEEQIDLEGDKWIFTIWGLSRETWELVFSSDFVVKFSCTDHTGGESEIDMTTRELTGTYSCNQTTVTITVASPEYLAGESYSERYDEDGVGITTIMSAIRDALVRGDARSVNTE